MRFHRVLIAVVLLVGLVGAGLRPVIAAEEVTVTASVDKTNITLNEQIQLEIELENADQFPDFRLDLDKFAIISGPAKSSNFQWVNGKSFSSKKILYTIAPLETGTHQIGPFNIIFDGKSYQTDPITIQVSDSPRNRSQRQSPTRAQSGESSRSASDDDVIFIEATADKQSVYPGEQLTVVYKIYTRVSVRNYSIENLPDAIGFWKEDIATPQNPRLTQETINGTRYSKATIKEVAYFPTQSGQLTIEPMPVTVEIQSSRRRSLFDDFFNDPFSRGATKRLVSNPLTVEVTPLPEEGQPNSFTGAVGTFKMTARVDTNRVTVDEAVGLTVTITGKGNIPTLTVKSPDVPDDLDMFDPEIEKQSSISGGRLQGAVTYQYVFIPREEGKLTLPEIIFSYFDPQSRQYRTLRSEQQIIEVLPLEEKARVAGSGYSREEVRLLNMDIRYLKPSLGQVRSTETIYYGDWKFYVPLFVALMLVGASIGYRYWREEWGEDVEYMRRKNAMKRAMNHIKQAQSRRQTAEYYSLLAKALLGFIGDKKNLPENALKTEDVKKVLQNTAVPDEKIQEVEQLLHKCDAGRFAPAVTEGADSDDLVVQIKSVLKTLNGYL